jgi:mRNA-degrading endonuclease toxin of MazEF toxin-antitoxin module
MSNVPEGVAREPKRSRPVVIISEVDSRREGVVMTLLIPVTCL